MKDHVVKPVSQPPQACLAGSDDEVSSVCSNSVSVHIPWQIRITRNNTQKCVFISPPPPHTFPSSYPPTCIYDPFPCKSGPVSFGKPEWRRAPCSKSPPSVSLSIDGLVEKFSQLNVRNDARIKGSPRPRSYAATAAITVIPSRAPHPSLIVHKHPKFAHVIVHYPSVHASAQCLQSPKSTSKPITSISTLCPSYRSEPPAKRKTAPLPQRLPFRMQNDKRDSTPSECSSTSSSSRVFSPNPGSRSCSFSSISSSSSPANMVSIELPRPSSCSPFGNPLYPCVFRDVAVSP